MKDGQIIHFDYKSVPYSQSKLGLYVPISIVGIILLVELIVNVTVYSIVITIPGLLLYIYIVLKRIDDTNKQTEKSIAEKKLQSVITEMCGHKSSLCCIFFMWYIW